MRWFPRWSGEYLRARRAAGFRDLILVLAVTPLLGYLRGLGVAPAAEAQVPSAPVDKLLAEFAGYLARERGLSARSVTSYQHHARPFLAGLAPPLDTALAELSAAEVTAFMVDHRGRWGTGTAKATVTALRSLLRFLHVTGRAPHSLAAAVPSVPGWRLAPLPADVNPDHVVALLASCDRRSAGGRRDYAILMLLSRLGLRAARWQRSSWAMLTGGPVSCWYVAREAAANACPFRPMSVKRWPSTCSMAGHAARDARCWSSCMPPTPG